MGRLVKNAAFTQNQPDSIGLPTGSTLTQPIHPDAGQIRFNTDAYHIEVFNGSTWDAVDGSTKFKVNKTAHGFTKFQAVYFDGTDWQLAHATSKLTVGFGIISRIISPNEFEIQQTGMLYSLTGLTPGTYYYVDDLTPGLLTSSEPPLFSNPLFYSTSATTGLVLPYRVTSSSGANGIAVDFTTIPQFNWTVAHNRGTTSVAYQAYDVNNIQIYPDTFTIDDLNNVTASFGEPQAGTLHLIFF